MMKHTTKRPKKLTRAERKGHDELVAELEASGIDPASRAALTADYVKLETRIARLSEREGDPELGNVQVTRAINVTVAERRRLRAALFKGARKPEPAQTAEQIRERAADIAWAYFYERLDEFADRSPEERAAREAELTKLYGEPSMRVLVIPRGEAITCESVNAFFDWIDGLAAA